MAKRKIIKVTGELGEPVKIVTEPISEPQVVDPLAELKSAYRDAALLVALWNQTPYRGQVKQMCNRLLAALGEVCKD